MQPIALSRPIMPVFSSSGTDVRQFHPEPMRENPLRHRQTAGTFNLLYSVFRNGSGSPGRLVGTLAAQAWLSGARRLSHDVARHQRQHQNTLAGAEKIRRHLPNSDCQN
jgi:hypothetical protein